MSENRPLPNIPTDCKTTFGIFKTQKLPLKIKKPKTDPPKYAHSEHKKSLGGPEGPSQVAVGHLEVAEGHQTSTGARRRAT